MDYSEAFIPWKTWLIGGGGGVKREGRPNVVPGLPPARLYDGSLGALDGGSYVARRFLKMVMSHVSVAYFPTCHMSNLRKIHVLCHSIFILMSHVT